jgi:SAM-dependent methyltransferase
VAWDPDFFHDAYPRLEAAFAARLDESLSPRDPSVLLQVVRELDLRPDSRVVDVACGEGAYAARLATHFGFRVLGIDPVQRHLDRARTARRDLAPAIAARLAFERGDATRVPVPDASLDLVWCRDAMLRLDHPDDAYAEFARVLRRGGHVVAHQVVATDLLAHEEADRLFEATGVVPSSADERVLDEAIAASGLEVVDTLDLAGEWGEWSQEQDGAGGRALLHLARLLRAPERYRDEFGRAAYDVMVAGCRWQVHLMTGGLRGRVDVLRRP